MPSKNELVEKQFVIKLTEQTNFDSLEFYTCGLH